MPKIINIVHQGLSMFTIPRFNTTCRGIIAHKQINILYRKLLYYNFTHLLLLLPCHRCYCYTIVFCVSYLTMLYVSLQIIVITCIVVPIINYYIVTTYTNFVCHRRKIIYLNKYVCKKIILVSNCITIHYTGHMN